MTGNIILQGGNLSRSTADASAALDVAWTVPQSFTHVHFPWFNGVDASGRPKAVPMIHPTQPATPYFVVPVAEALWQRGQLLLVSWGARNLKGATGAPVAVTSADVTAGKYDDYLHMSAQTLAKFGRPLIIALNPEFNWSGGLNYMPGPEFVAFWRYVVSLFRVDGATNVAWAWHANQLGKPGAGTTTAEDRLAEFWPGAEWVDLVGVDTYNRGASAGASTWLTFDQILTGEGTTWLGNTFGAVTQLAPGLPVIIGEFGCHTAPGDKAAWIRDALASIPTKYPRISMISYYGLNDGPSHWALDVADGTVQAWADGILRGPYALPGRFPMPADVQALAAGLSGAVTWGDELARLSGQLSVLTAQVADCMAELEQALGAQEAAEQRAGTAEADLATAEADLADVATAVRTLAKFGAPA